MYVISRIFCFLQTPSEISVFTLIKEQNGKQAHYFHLNCAEIIFLCPNCFFVVLKNMHSGEIVVPKPIISKEKYSV